MKAPAGATFFGSDKYSSSEEDEDISLPPLGKRKRAKNAGPSKSAGPSGEPQKARRVSAGQGMTAMADSLQEIVSQMQMRRDDKAKAACKLEAQLPTNPLERAAVMCQRDHKFSDNELMEAIDIFQMESDFARAYCALQSARTRKLYLERRMRKLRGETV